MSYDVPMHIAQQRFPNSLTVGNTTVAKVLVPLTPGKVLDAVTSETALYGETSVRQRVFQGGCRIIDAIATSTDAAAKSLLLHTGQMLSSFSAVSASGAQPAITGFTSGTITGTNAIVRTAGSFITDGWQVGDSAMVFGDVTQTANNGILLQVTAVVALTLTFTGTVLTNETSAAGLQVFKIARLSQFPVAANSGNADAVPSVPLIGTGAVQNKSWDQTGLSLGANEILIGNLVANASALPARIDVDVVALLY